MRDIVPMREIYCGCCRRRSLVNAEYSYWCLSCGRSKFGDRLSRARGIECPSCKILHPGKNVGAPLCGRCHNKHRREVRETVSSSDESALFSDSENSQLSFYLDDSFEVQSSFADDSFDDCSPATRPLPYCVVQTLQRKLPFGRDLKNECSICFEAFRRRCTLVELKCKHLYHEKCLLKWFLSNDTCPLCRQVVN